MLCFKLEGEKEKMSTEINLEVRGTRIENAVKDTYK
jgi:hypothetical protein